MVFAITILALLVVIAITIQISILGHLERQDVDRVIDVEEIKGFITLQEGRKKSSVERMLETDETFKYEPFKWTKVNGTIDLEKYKRVLILNRLTGKTDIRDYARAELIDEMIEYFTKTRNGFREHDQEIYDFLFLPIVIKYNTILRELREYKAYRMNL